MVLPGNRPGRHLYLEEPPVRSSHGHHRARRDARGNLDHELLALSDGLSDGLGHGGRRHPLRLLLLLLLLRVDRRRPRLDVLDALQQIRLVAGGALLAGLRVALRRIRLREADAVLGVGLGVVVGHEDARVRHVVDRRVVEEVAPRVAHVGRQRVLDALGPRADDDAHGEDGLQPAPVGGRVEWMRAVRCVPRKVDALAVERRVLAAEGAVEALLEDLIDDVGAAAVEQPVWKSNFGRHRRDIFSVAASARWREAANSLVDFHTAPTSSYFRSAATGSFSRATVALFFTQYDCHRLMFWTRSMEWILSCCGPVVRLMALYTRWYSSLPCCSGKYSAMSGSFTWPQYFGGSSAESPAPPSSFWSSPN